MIGGVFSIVAASLLAFAVMAAAMVLIEAKGIVRTRHFWDIGAVLAGGRKRKRARFLTLAVHGSLAIVFGFIYVGMWATLDLADPAFYIVIGLITGIIHGVGAAAGLIILLANDNEGMKVGVAQIATHALFGLVFGATIAVLENKFEPVAMIARMIENRFFYS